MPLIRDKYLRVVDVILPLPGDLQFLFEFVGPRLGDLLLCHIGKVL